MIWKRKITLEALNAMGEGNMVGLLDIRFEHIGDDTLEAPGFGWPPIAASLMQPASTTTRPTTSVTVKYRTAMRSMVRMQNTP